MRRDAEKAEVRDLEASQNESKVDLSIGISDLLEGLMMWRTWGTMAFWDVRRRYRRTLLGPFWTSLSHAIFICAMGFLFATLWDMDVTDYLPYLASGFVSWIFISTVITESCTVFVAAEPIIKQTQMPYSIFVLNLVARNIIVIGHHLIVFSVIIVAFPVEFTRYTLLFIPGLLLLCLIGASVGLSLGMLCARYRDVSPVVVSCLQIAMFVTPIFWPTENLGEWGRVWLVEPNILYHAVSVIRQPLLGEAPTVLNWAVVIGIAFVGWAVTLRTFAKHRRTIVFWV